MTITNCPMCDSDNIADTGYVDGSGKWEDAICMLWFCNHCSYEWETDCIEGYDDQGVDTESEQE